MLHATINFISVVDGVIGGDYCTDNLVIFGTVCSR